MFAKREVEPAGGAAGAAEQPLPLGPGYVIGATYRVERLLGHDAMGSVVAATHLQLKERVTLRFLRPAAGAGGAERRSRLVSEAQRSARIENEHLPRVLEVGALGDGTPFFVAEYLEGRDLGARLREGVALHASEAVEYVIQACAGLAETHMAGVAHRDVRPENLYLVRRPDGSPLVKVLGFGISKLVPRGAQLPPLGEGGADEAPASIYSAPEQLRPGRGVDQRSDVWSLGAVLFELLTGRPAFAASSLPELCGLVFEQPTPRASAFRPELPAGLDEAVMRCLARDPDERFQNVVDVAFALLPFAPRRAGAVVERAAVALGVSITRLADAPGAASSGRLVAAAAASGRPSMPLSSPQGAGPGPASATAPPTARPQAASEWQAQRRTLQIGTAVALAMIAAGMAGLVLERRSARVPDAPAAVTAETAPPEPSASPPAEASAPAAPERAEARPLGEGPRAPKTPHKLKPLRPSAPASPARPSPDLDIRMKR